jgi:hypothetical protein
MLSSKADVGIDKLVDAVAEVAMARGHDCFVSRSVSLATAVDVGSRCIVVFGTAASPPLIPWMVSSSNEAINCVLDA